MTTETDLQLARRRMRWAFPILLLGGILLLAAASLLFFSPPSVSSGPPRIGQRLANFSLPSLSGKVTQLDQYRGQPVLLNFWAIWCPPCREEMPLLEAYAQQHRTQGLVLLAINVGDEPEKARTFVDELQLTFPILLDQEQSLSDRLLIEAFPTSVFIDKDGVVRSIHVGRFTQEQIEAEITPLLPPVR
jgi:thiol-disulfide isomerase/thioredoxin